MSMKPGATMAAGVEDFGAATIQLTRYRRHTPVLNQDIGGAVVS